MLQLFKHMSENQLLYPHQSAYKPNHGIETALSKVKNYILCALDTHRTVFLVLDLSAAFDTIDFNIVDARLQHTLGANGTVRSWIMSCLHDHSSRVCVSVNFSSDRTAKFGCLKDLW